METQLVRSAHNRNLALWALCLVSCTIFTTVFLVSRMTHGYDQLASLARMIAQHQGMLAQRPIIDQRLARLQTGMSRARTFGVTAPNTPLAVSAIQAQLAALIVDQGATVTAIQVTTTKSEGLRLAHVALTATAPLASLQPLLDALGDLPWALRLTRIAIGHGRNGSVRLRLALTLPFFRASP